MFAFFVACAVLGGLVVIAQVVVAGGMGADALDGDAGHDTTASSVGHGLDLFSVRSLAAGVAFLGLAGAAGLSAGWPVAIATGAALLAGTVAAVSVAAIMRQMLRLEDDGTVRDEHAVGASADVYLTVPADRSGAGKITLTLQGRTVEYEAVTRGTALPTGTSVVVVDVVGPGLVEVVATPEVGV